MDAKDLLVDYCSNWKHIEHLLELFPELDVVSSLAYNGAPDEESSCSGAPAGMKCAPGELGAAG